LPISELTAPYIGKIFYAVMKVLMLAFYDVLKVDS